MAKDSRSPLEVRKSLFAQVDRAAEAVGANRVLSQLAPADFSRLVPHLKDVPLERGQVLHDTGGEIEHVYFPHSGMVSIVVVMPDGETVETATIGREGAVGLAVGLGLHQARCRAIVQLPGTAARLSAARFAEVAQSSEALRKLVAHHADLLLVQVQQSVACNALHDVEARLCRWLLHTRDCIGSDVLPLTQEFLSQMLGVRRTTVTLVAGMLQSAGMIHYRRGLIQIHDVVALKEAACDCYGIVHALKHGGGRSSDFRALGAGAPPIVTRSL